MTINERIANEVMGWRLSPKYPWRYRWEPTTRRWVAYDNFESGLDACAIAEAEIERRGLRFAYTCALEEAYRQSPSPFETWFYATLTPAQRCAAMLAAAAKAEASDGHL